MTQGRHDARETARMIRSFIATYDAQSADDRQIAARIRERLHSELYRRERANPEWVDLGGEGGEL